MVRTKVVILRTLGGNKDNSNPRQMAHDHIWDTMNNGKFGIADYYQNSDPQKGYDIYDQIVQCNHDKKPNWKFDDIAFIFGVYTSKYYSRFTPLADYNGIDLFPSILYPYRDGDTSFIRLNKRGDIGIDIAFQYYKKIDSLKSIELDEILLNIKKMEFENNILPSNYPALCFTIELQSFMKFFIKK